MKKDKAMLGDKYFRHKMTSIKSKSLRASSGSTLPGLMR